MSTTASAMIVGDLVRRSYGGGRGIVAEITGDGDYYVSWDNDDIYLHLYHREELEFLSDVYDEIEKDLV